jgi:glycosyltransferase involved in cell wall biosynthesis
LSNAINSILEQTFKDWELIIIDDGSTDDTLQTVNSFKKSTDKIKYFFQPNSGVSSARNKGAELASGEYLVFLDSDDFVEISWLMDFFLASDKNIDIIYCYVKIVNELGHERIKKPNKVFFNVESSFITGAFAIRKDFFYNVNGYDPFILFGENTDLCIRVSSRKHSYRIVPQVNLTYKRIESKRSHEYSKKIISSNLIIIRKIESGAIQYERHYLSLLYRVIAYHYHKENKKSHAIKCSLKAIQIEPQYFKNWIGFIKILIR